MEFYIVIFLIFVSYTINSISHEYLNLNLKIKSPYLITCTQFCGFFITSLVKYKKFRKLKWNELVLLLFCAILELLTKYGQNYAALTISYPVESMFKTAKILPVFLINYIFKFKVPECYDWIIIIFLIGGLISLSIAQIESSRNFNYIGLCSAVFSLITDSICANIEAYLLISIDFHQVIFMIYCIAFFILLCFFPLQYDSLNFNSRELMLSGCIFMLSSGFALSAQYFCTSKYGIVITVLITSLRKSLSVVFSYIFFPNKPFSMIHFLGYLVLFIGMFANIFKKVLMFQRTD